MTSKVMTNSNGEPYAEYLYELLKHISAFSNENVQLDEDMMSLKTSETREIKECRRFYFTLMCAAINL